MGSVDKEALRYFKSLSWDIADDGSSMTSGSWKVSIRHMGLHAISIEIKKGKELYDTYTIGGPCFDKLPTYFWKMGYQHAEQVKQRSKERILHARD